MANHAPQTRRRTPAVARLIPPLRTVTSRDREIREQRSGRTGKEGRNGVGEVPAPRGETVRAGIEQRSERRHDAAPDRYKNRDTSRCVDPEMPHAHASRANTLNPVPLHLATTRNGACRHAVRVGTYQSPRDGKRVVAQRSAVAVVCPSVVDLTKACRDVLLGAPLLFERDGRRNLLVRRRQSRLHDRSGPEVPHSHHVDLRGRERDLGRQIEEGDQAEHQRKGAVLPARVPE